MKSKALLTAALLSVAALFVATPAHAIAPFVQFQDSKDGGMGYGVGVKHSFLGIVPMVGFDLRASWLHYGDKEEVPEAFELFPLEAAATLGLGIFYVGLGGGYYAASGDIAPDSELGGFALGGIGFKLFGLGASAELRYLMLEPGAADMSGFGANLGVTLPL